jgi:hypothetical protein
MHALCADMTNDQELRNILKRHIQGMDNTYHQAINLLQNKGIDMTGTNVYHTHAQHHPHIGVENQLNHTKVR